MALSGVVNAEIKEGWEPYGDPFFSHELTSEDEGYYCQAMVKYEQ